MKKKEILLALSFTFIFSFIIMFLDVSTLKYWSAVLLFSFLPGYAFVQYFFKSGELQGLEKIPVSVILSLTFVTVGYYTVYYFIGSFSKSSLLLFMVFPVIFFLFLAFFRHDESLEHRTFRFKKEDIILIILVLFTLYFRFTGLGYSEYQGDECYNCIIKSIDALLGNRETLVNYERPPTKIIIPTLSYFLTGDYNEYNIRLPFALAGSVSIIAIYLLGKSLFGKFAGIVAGFLLAVNGFHIAFSRIVQYQSVTVLAITCCIYLLMKFRVEENCETARKYLFLAFTFYAFSLFTHYEHILIFPLIFYLAVEKYGLKRLPEYKSIFLPAIAIFLFITFIFYIPYVLHPNIKSTVFDHILKTRVGMDFSGKTIGWRFNLDYILLVSSYYNSGVYFLFLCSFALFSLHRMDFSKKILLFWFLIYFLPQLFMKKPGTHVYNAFPALCLLAASGLGSLYDLSLKNILSRRTMRAFLLAGFITFLIYCSLFSYTRFINQKPEYHWETKPEAKDRIFAHFGFPYHRGWKAVGYLFRSKQLQGSYRSNEKTRITEYYLRQKSTDSDLPRYIIMTANPQKSRPELKLSSGYCMIIGIIHKEKKTIEIYERKDCENKKPIILKSKDYEEAYDLLDKNPENLDSTSFEIRRLE